MSINNEVYHPFNKILDNLYLGNKEAADKYGDKFQLVVNCTKDIPFPKHCKKAIRIPVNDAPEESSKLLYYIKNTQALEHIRESLLKKENVLIHCFAGAQRSCATTACYLMKYHNATPEQAIDYIKSQRAVAFFGSVNFQHAIDEFYKKL